MKSFPNSNFKHLLLTAGLLLSTFVSSKNNSNEHSDQWFQFSRPILEWINPYQNINGKEYVETIIKKAKAANANTVYFVIDRGGSPLYNGSIEPKDTLIGDFDMIGYLEKRLHAEGMYFVAAQFGTHTLSTLGKRHPDWLMRDAKGEVIYGPGSVPQMCFNTGYAQYVAEELGQIVGKYKVDGVYVEGLYYAPKNCCCAACREKYQKQYGKAVPETALRNDTAISPFHIQSIVGFIDRVNKKIKKASPSTILMACPPVNRPNTHQVDWNKLGNVCDVVTVEMMWGYRNVFPLWMSGMSVSVMQAESKKPCFTTAWYAIDVDREYTPRSKVTQQLNYFESIINGATCQFHTQNALEEAPDNIPVLNELYSYTQKIRPYLLNAERVQTVALLYDRDDLIPGSNFSGYYKSLKYNHIPFKVISRNDLNTESLKETSVLVLANINRITANEFECIKNFASNGGTVVATYKTGFQKKNAPTTEISDFLGIKTISGEKIANRKVGENWIPENFRIEHNMYFRNKKGSFADDASGLSLLTYSGGILKIVPTPDAEIVASVLELDESRKSAGNPILYGYYPGKESHPLIIQRKQGSGRVIYFAGDLDKANFEQGYDFLSGILAKAATPDNVSITADAPSTVSITYFKQQSSKSMIIHLLNGTTNQSLYPDPASEIIPVSNITFKVKGYKSAKSVNGNSITTSLKDGCLNITVSKLDLIDTIILN